MKEFNSLKWILCAVAISYTSSCDPGIDQDPPPDTDNVLAIYNPTAKTIPLPNAAALETDGTLPNLGSGGKDALSEAYNYLDQYAGFSPKTPIVIPFSGELKEDTITPESVTLYEVDGKNVTKLESFPKYVKNSGALCNPEICEAVIYVIPKIPLQVGHQYAALVTKDVKGTNGKSVKEDLPVFFGLSKNAIYKDAEVQLKLFKDKPETAKSLEGIRQQLAPIVAALKLERENVASLFTWSTVKNGLTVMDPASSTLPVPNTLALDRDGSFPSGALNYCNELTKPTEACVKPTITKVACEKKEDCTDDKAHLGNGYDCIGGVCKNQHCAQGDFDAYLDALHGWPTTTPISLPVMGTIDASTLTRETVQLFKIENNVPTKVADYTVALDPCGDKITITPTVPMGYNEKYFAFATRDVMTLSKDSTGKTIRLPLLPPAEVFLAIQPYDVLTKGEDCTGKNIGEACDDDKGICAPFREDDTVSIACGKTAIAPLGVDDMGAFKLHMIRPLLRGTAEAIEQLTSINYKKLAAVWSWYTWTDTFSVFDPSAGSIPFPHAFLTTGCSEEQPICNIPQGSDPLSKLLYEELSRRPGFSTTAPNWVPFAGQDPDPATVNTDTVVFSEVKKLPELMPKDEYEVRLLEHNAVLDYKRPLQKNGVVAGLIINEMKGTNGFPVQPSPAFVFLRSNYPLVANGKSTIAQLPDSSAAVLEPSRKAFKELFTAAAILGFGREQIANAWAYKTQDTTRPLQDLRALTLSNLAADGLPAITEANAKTEIAPNFANGDGTTTLADEPTIHVDVSNLASIHWNMEYNSYWWLEDNGHFSAAKFDMPSKLPIGVSVFVPETTATCTAPFNVAIVQHGHTSYRKRIGLAYANTLAGNCIATVVIDLPLHGGRMPSEGNLHPDQTPTDSGKGFISADFVAVKSMFMQTAVDLTVLTRLVKGGAFNAIIPNFSGSASKIGFIGQSMGALIGTLFVTVEKDITNAVINVGGGFFYNLLTESQAFAPLFDTLKLPKGSMAELKALYFIQWLGDLADPYGYAPYVKNVTLKEITYDVATKTFAEGADLPANEVMMQMVIDDPVVPNSGTERVAHTIGIELTDTTYPKGTRHGFVAGLDPNANDGGKAGVCARKQGADFLLNAFGVTTTIEPANDCMNH